METQRPRLGVRIICKPFHQRQLMQRLALQSPGHFYLYFYTSLCSWCDTSHWCGCPASQVSGARLRALLWSWPRGSCGGALPASLVQMGKRQCGRDNLRMDWASEWGTAFAFFLFAVSSVLFQAVLIVSNLGSSISRNGSCAERKVLWQPAEHLQLMKVLLQNQ